MPADNRQFAEQLQELKNRLLLMGSLAEGTVRKASHGLLTRDAALTRNVIDNERLGQCAAPRHRRLLFKLLALHQPMAVDLRTIVAAVKINGDLERVGDLAVNIAEEVIFAVAGREVRQRSLVRPL